MTRSPAGKYPSELLFEDYLRSRGYSFEYEPRIGRKCPDYLVHSTPDILCEVKEMSVGEEDLPALAAAASGESWFGSVDTPRRIRERLNAGAKQLSEFKGRYPSVIVLRNTAAVMVELETMLVQSAMYGNLQVIEPIDFDDRPAPSEARAVYERKTAKMTVGRNTTVSAVAVLEYVYPHKHLVDAHLHSIKATMSPGTNDFATLLRAYDAFVERHAEVEDVALRIRVIHNRYALVPLPRSIFAGPYDEQID